MTPVARRPRHRGASPTTSNAGRLALAAPLGARTLRPTAPPRSSSSSTPSGNPASLDVALRHVAIGGTCSCSASTRTPFEIAAQTLVRRQLHRPRSLTYDHPGDFQTTVGRVQAGAISPGGSITDEYALADAQRAFERAARPAARPGSGWPGLSRAADVSPRRRHRGAEAQQVAVHAEPGDLALGDLRDHRDMPERLPRVDVRDVDLDDRHVEDRQRVPDGVAVMRPGARVDDDGIDLAVRLGGSARTSTPSTLVWNVSTSTPSSRAERSASRRRSRRA